SQGLSTVSDDRGIEALPAQHDGQHLRQGSVVIDDQNPLPHGVHGVTRSGQNSGTTRVFLGGQGQIPSNSLAERPRRAFPDCPRVDQSGGPPTRIHNPVDGQPTPAPPPRGPARVHPPRAVPQLLVPAATV